MSDSIWGPFLGTTTGILTVLGTIYAAINHKKIVAKCCGRRFEFEIHVDDAKNSRGSHRKIHPEESSEQTETSKEKQREHDINREKRNIKVETQETDSGAGLQLPLPKFTKPRLNLEDV